MLSNTNLYFQMARFRFQSGRKHAKIGNPYAHKSDGKFEVRHRPQKHIKHTTMILYKKIMYRFIHILSLLGILWVSFTACHNEKAQHMPDFNLGWDFALVNDSIKSADQINNWEQVNIPHDWSVHAPFDSIKGEGATGYLPGGIGYYRKTFTVEACNESTCFLVFDGVYNNSTVWINGKFVGNHPYGYSPFYFDISPYLNKSLEKNTLLVRVDHSRYADSRWYTGSGIYREVKLLTVPKVHIPVWGSFVTTPHISESSATVRVEVKIKNKYPHISDGSIETVITDPSGRSVASASQSTQIDANGTKVIEHDMIISNPMLWDPESPNLYTVTNYLIQKNKKIQQQTLHIGIRSFRFDADHGFFLNGKNIKIKGVCLHHDGGLVGAAVPRGVWERRLKKLKDAGCNAIRISHNPASNEFLDICDEMGFLVQDEFFDEWDYPKDKRLNMEEKSVDYITRGYNEHFHQWAKHDLQNTVLSHRNHPSIFQWSIGNEIEWTYPKNAKATGFFGNLNWDGNYFWSQPPNSIPQIKTLLQSETNYEYHIGETAQKLASWTKALDKTRPITANCILPSASYESGYADALDVIGFSYRRVMYDYGHKNYPTKPLMGTENLAQWHEWKAIEERPFVAGTFLWTGIDYMGESNGQWPRKTLPSGMLDQAGFSKPSYHMMKCLWNDAPHVYMSTQRLHSSIYKLVNNKPMEKKKDAWQKALWIWHDVNDHFNYHAHDTIVAEVISNCPEVSLYLNGDNLGTKRLTDFPDHIYKWAFPFAAGELKAVGHHKQGDISYILHTAQKATAIKLSADKASLKANYKDVCHLVAQLVDAQGYPVKTEEKDIEFTITGDVHLLGVDNGAPDNVQAYRSNVVRSAKGRCLAIVQSTEKTGKVEIRVHAKGCKPASTTLRLY